MLKVKAKVKEKPVNLNLTTIKFPITAIVSILHRMSGVILFISIPLMLSLLACSLDSAKSFARLQASLSHPFYKLLLWLLISALLYHLVAGIRHLLMDQGIGETREGGCWGAKITFAVSIVLILIVGVKLW